MQDLADVGTRDHRQVGALACRGQKSGGRVAAPVAAQGELVAPHAVGLGAIEVGRARVAGLGCGVQPGFAIGVVVAQVRHAQFASAAMEFVSATVIAFRAFEVGQHLLVAPAGRAQRRPVVVVGALAADVEQAVDGAGAAQHLATRPDHGAVAGLGLCFDRELPGKALVVDGAKVAYRQTQPKPLRWPTGFEQQDAAGRVGAQAVGQHATGRSGADDDVVKTLV